MTKQRMVKAAKVKVAKVAKPQSAIVRSQIADKPKVDINKSRLYEVASACESILRQSGVRVEKRSNGMLVLTKPKPRPRDKLARKQMTTNMLLDLLNESGVFGIWQCKDERGRSSCWEPQPVPYDAVELMLKRAVGRRMLPDFGHRQCGNG